jgi:hypothetical protein
MISNKLALGTRGGSTMSLGPTRPLFIFVSCSIPFSNGCQGLHIVAASLYVYYKLTPQSLYCFKDCQSLDVLNHGWNSNVVHLHSSDRSWDYAPGLYCSEIMYDSPDNYGVSAGLLVNRPPVHWHMEKMVVAQSSLYPRISHGT